MYFHSVYVFLYFTINNSMVMLFCLQAAALQTYEKKSKEMKDILEEQEKLAVASLSIEKERIIAEEVLTEDVTYIFY